MKLEVKYNRINLSEVSVSIQVLDGGVYPFEAIFRGEEDWPTKSGFKLREGSCRISTIAKDNDAAKKWAELQVEALKASLNAWWNLVIVPENEIVTSKKCYKPGSGGSVTGGHTPEKSKAKPVNPPKKK